MFIRCGLSGLPKVQGRDAVTIMSLLGSEQPSGKGIYLRQARNMKMSIVLVYWWQGMVGLVFMLSVEQRTTVSDMSYC